MRRKLLRDVDEVDSDTCLQQARSPIRHVFDQDLAPTVEQEAI